MRTITTEELHAIHQESQNPQDPPRTILDVRSPAEYAEGHIAGAINIPHDAVQGRLAEVPSGGPVYVHCKMGGRAQRAAAVLEAAGRDVVCVASGGMNEWMERGFSTE